MDAVKFVKTLGRMCNAECIKCEFWKRRGKWESCNSWQKNHPEEAVAIVEQWAAEIASYHATEIDKFAIQATQANFPDVVQLGDAFQVREDGWTYAGLTGGASEAAE